MKDLYFIGIENEATISAGSETTLEIEYQGDRTFKAHALSIRYADGNENSTIQIQEKGSGRFLTDGPVHLCSIGRRSDGATVGDARPLALSLSASQGLRLTVKAITNNISAGTFNAVLIGQEV